jgi:hypothetical protein
MNTDRTGKQGGKASREEDEEREPQMKRDERG